MCVSPPGFRTNPSAAPLQRRQAVDELALVIRLKALDREPELSAERRGLAHDLGERLPPVDLGLALPEEVQVRPIQDPDARRLNARHGSLGAGLRPPISIRGRRQFRWRLAASPTTGLGRRRAPENTL